VGIFVGGSGGLKCWLMCGDFVGGCGGLKQQVEGIGPCACF